MAARSRARAQRDRNVRWGDPGRGRSRRAAL